MLLEGLHTHFMVEETGSERYRNEPKVMQLLDNLTCSSAFQWLHWDPWVRLNHQSGMGWCLGEGRGGAGLLGEPTSGPGCPPHRGAAWLTEISPERDPSQSCRGGRHGRGLGMLPPRVYRPSRFTPSCCLSPSMNQSGSDLECSGTLGSAGVACPQGLLPTEVVYGWKV